ncbi:hypothetical protein E1B28_000312 [Marasmius oreades]|uniref:Protein kinase domain-containing protein n=1 Tax=Marasmius oreades TaxID=181124 RepID=A0A9P8AEB8_9AGAR|nr:uncharacterized protein E1B28_000312 [Marasmius oreades]KAG7098353.1 hypothetical protein E1B28_000312 [Marasmius oreades]
MNSPKLSDSRETESVHSSGESDNDEELWLLPPSTTTAAPRILPRPSVIGTASDLEWAARPQHGDIYERLEDFFPEHDLDKPILAQEPENVEDAKDSGTVAAVRRIAERKSIRTLAEEYSKRNRTNAVEGGTPTDTELKKRTKLWGSKLEVQHIPGTAHSLQPDSPSKPQPAAFKWVCGELIGRGTYDRVYHALNAETGGMMAVKQVELPTMVNDRRQMSFLHALKREMEMLKDLDHPNIVQYLGFEETPSKLSMYVDSYFFRFCLVFLCSFLEYVPGGSIGGVLRTHGKLNEGNTIFFTTQILEGLDYLHSKDITHGNLTSDNILLETNGICKISDFGLSRRPTDPESEELKLHGAVFWMAPELLTSQRDHSSKVDIWSIGCLFLEMVSGRRPWTGENTFAVMLQIYQKQLPPPVPVGTHLPDLAEDFKARCFAIDPDERPSVKELLGHEYLKLSPDWKFTRFVERTEQRS